MSNAKPVMVGGRLESRSFFEGRSVEDPAKKVAALGETLAKVFDLKRQQMSLLRELWRVYVADCKRLGIEPVKANVSVM